MNKNNKEQLTNSIIDMLKEKLIKEYTPGTTKRDAHAKSLGLLKAYFIVEPNIPKEYQVGIFKEAKTYKALIRVSNSLTDDNRKKDVRGFAIKLLGVNGKKVASDEKYTQDFILVSTETMPLGTLELFHDAIYYTTKSNPLLFGLQLLKNKQLYILKDLLKTKTNPTSPLDISYFSTTPYSFSNKVVKYKIEPSSSYKSQMPKKLTSTYLTDNMQSHLNNYEATFNFYAQFQSNKDNMPINDASVKWDSPFIKLGEIKIPPQNFTTKERNDLGEILSFSPGHSIIEHKAIGDMNIARIKIYEEMSKFRHDRNNKHLFEPNEETFDNIK